MTNGRRFQRGGGQSRHGGNRHHGGHTTPHYSGGQRDVSDRRGDSGEGRCAVPFYIGKNFEDAPPGHRYLLYLPFWKNNWTAIDSGKHKVLEKISKLPEHTKEIMRNLSARQLALGKIMNSEIIRAKSTSPFATGLGWEHPNENGFAFLSPYGLPYLAGSGVKGVVRKAAQELADGLTGNSEGWTNDAVKELFGLEPPERSQNASIGALRFCDVFPQMLSMDVEIMNPHYSDYYMGKDNSSPHDAGQPMPIFFLVVPQKSRFNFIVDCIRKLPEDLKSTWRVLIHSAFQHAFDWLGFGAKTAVGYGQMNLINKGEEQETEEKEEELSPKEKALPSERWSAATLRWNPGNQTLTAYKDNKRSECKIGQNKSVIPESLHNKLFGKKKETKADITIEKCGTICKIIKVEESNE